MFSLNPDLAVEGTETFRATSTRDIPSGPYPIFQNPAGVTFATTLINILDNDSKYQLPMYVCVDRYNLVIFHRANSQI